MRERKRGMGMTMPVSGISGTPESRARQREPSRRIEIVRGSCLRTLTGSLQCVPPNPHRPSVSLRTLEDQESNCVNFVERGSTSSFKNIFPLSSSHCDLFACSSFPDDFPDDLNRFKESRITPPNFSFYRARLPIKALW